jgi:hypothetical protein
MSPRPIAIAAIAGAVLLAALPLGACGKQGALERPGPLFGAGRNTTKQPDEAERQAQTGRASDTIDPRGRTTDPAPPRTYPIPGTSPNPFQTAPQGAMPDPYANPR